MDKEVPIWEKEKLTIQEASAYSNIGLSKLRFLVKEEEAVAYVVYEGRKQLILREAFDDFLMTNFSI